MRAIFEADVERGASKRFAPAGAGISGWRLDSPAIRAADDPGGRQPASSHLFAVRFARYAGVLVLGAGVVRVDVVCSSGGMGVVGDCERAPAAFGVRRVTRA